MITNVTWKTDPCGNISRAGELLCIAAVRDKFRASEENPAAPEILRYRSYLMRRRLDRELQEMSMDEDYYPEFLPEPRAMNLQLPYYRVALKLCRIHAWVLFMREQQREEIYRSQAVDHTRREHLQDAEDGDEVDDEPLKDSDAGPPLYEPYREAKHLVI